MAQFDDHAAVGINRKVVPLGNRKVELSGLTLGDLIECRCQALDEYRRSQIKAWTKNADLMPEAQKDDWVRQAFERAEQLTADDLPARYTTLPVRDARGKLERRSGKLVTKEQKVEYAIWWACSTFEGKLFSMWLSMRRSPQHEGITLDEVDQMLVTASGADQILREELLEEISDSVGELSTSKLGNA